MDTENLDESFLDFKCPYCGALNSFPASATGVVRECVNCLSAFILPEPGAELGRKLPFPIETPKIRLRPFEAGDWEDLTKFEFETDDEATEWLHRQSSIRLTSPDEAFSVAAQDKETGKIVARLGLKFLDFSFQQIELSISASAAAEASGLDSETIAAGLEFCFVDLKVHRVVAQSLTDNDELCRLFPAVGMRKEAEFVKNVLFGDRWYTTCWFAMLEEEYSQP